MATERPASSVWLLALITKNDNLTHEEFSTYWREDHAKLVAPWLEKQGVLTYRQLHISPKTAALLGGDPSSDNFIKHDGAVLLEVPSLEAWAQAVQDPYYAEVIMPDEQKFFQGKKIVMGLGELFGWVEGGKAVV